MKAQQKLANILQNQDISTTSTEGVNCRSQVAGCRQNFTQVWREFDSFFCFVVSHLHDGAKKRMLRFPEVYLQQIGRETTISSESPELMENPD